MVEYITDLEDAYSKLMVEFFKLRKAGKIQEEYDEKGIIINILSEDRQFIRENYEGIIL